MTTAEQVEIEQPITVASAIRNITWTVEEAALLLGVHEITVRRMIGSGRLGSTKIGFRRVIPHAALLGYLVEAVQNPFTRQATIDLMRSHAQALGKEFDIDAILAELESGNPI